MNVISGYFGVISGYFGVLSYRTVQVKIRESTYVVERKRVLSFLSIITVYHKHLYKVLLHSTRVVLVLLVDFLSQ